MIVTDKATWFNLIAIVGLPKIQSSELCGGLSLAPPQRARFLLPALPQLQYARVAFARVSLRAKAVWAVKTLKVTVSMAIPRFPTRGFDFNLRWFLTCPLLVRFFVFHAAGETWEVFLVSLREYFCQSTCVLLCVALVCSFSASHFSVPIFYIELVPERSVSKLHWLDIDSHCTPLGPLACGRRPTHLQRCQGTTSSPLLWHPALEIQIGSVIVLLYCFHPFSALSFF